MATEALTLDNAKVGLCVRNVSHPEWGLFLLVRDRNGWIVRAANGNGSMLDEGEFSFWVIEHGEPFPEPEPDPPMSRSDILDMVAAHAGSDPHALVQLLDELRELATMRAEESRIPAPLPRTKRTRAEIEADVIATVASLGYLRETWPKPYQELVRSGRQHDARRKEAHERARKHQVTVTEYMTRRDALHVRLESLGVDLVLTPPSEQINDAE